MDFPRAWQLTRTSKMEDHDPRCSWRVGGLLCDCPVITQHPEYLDDILQTLNGVRWRQIRDYGIPFAGDMVRAIIEDRKGQTRRIIRGKDAELLDWIAGECPEELGQRWAMHDDEGHSGAGLYVWTDADQSAGSERIRCRYGLPGDRLWVREHWKVASNLDDEAPSEMVGMKLDEVRYMADGDTDLSGRERRAMHMPRWASRITLKSKSIRIEKLQDITTPDIVAEGAFIDTMDGMADDEIELLARAQWIALWESIHGAGSWALNPWVWRIEFEKVRSAA